MLHESLLLACRRLEIPPPLLSYLTQLHDGSTTRLKYNGSVISQLIVVRRGVKHRSPSSSVIWFSDINMVMGWVVAEINKECAIRMVRVSVRADVTHLMFADGTVILAHDAAVAQHQLRKFEKALAKCGLRLNSATSAALVIRANRRRKQWITAIDSQIRTLDGRPIPILDLKDRRYLGLRVG